MVAELKNIISSIEKLTDDEQRHLAKMLRDEISGMPLFKKSQNNLSTLAEKLSLNMNIRPTKINKQIGN